MGRRYLGGTASSASAVATAAQTTANGAIPKAVSVFDQALNSTVDTVTAADVNVGALTLLTDAITAIGTLQTAINKDRHLINRLINIVRGAG